MKQEILEKAAEEWIKGFGGLSNSKQSFIEGAKWQSERMYSDEEVISILYSFHKEDNSRVVFSLSGINKWFEQFKKNNMKQTAIEWLEGFFYSESKELGFDKWVIPGYQMEKIIDYAKKMENIQLQKAIEYGYQLRNNNKPINSGIDWVKEFNSLNKQD